MKVSELIENLEEVKSEHGDVDVYFVNDQYEAEPIRWAGASVFAEGGSFNGDGLGPIAEEDLDEYDETFVAVELQ